VGNEPVASGIEGPGGRAGFLKGFFVAAVLVFIVFWLVPVRYTANDDFALVKLLSERSGFSPDPNNPSLNFSMGWILCFLYRYGPDLPWYGLFVCTACYLGWSLMLSVLFRSTQGLSLLLSLPFLGMVFFHLTSFISFTAASLILESGVFLCLMEWGVRERCAAKNPRLYGWALALAFLISYLLRWRLVLVSLVFGGPVLLFVKKQQMAKAIPFVMAVGLVIVGDRAIFHLTTSDQHKAFMEYNDLRAQFHDTARGEYYGDSTPKALEKVGWSPEDYFFYKQWVLYDNREFNERTLRTFLEENDPKKKRSLFARNWNGLKEHFRQGKRYLLALLFSIVSIGFYRVGGLSELARRNRLKILLALAYIGAGIVSVVSIRSVFRVFVPLYVYFFVACFLFFHLTKRESAQGRSRSVGRNVSVICAVVFSILAWGQAYAQGKLDFRILKGSKMEKEYIQKTLSVVKNRSAVPEPLLILMNPASGLGAEYVHPLKEFSDFTDLRIFPAGWGVHSPWFSSILRDMGLTDGRAFLTWMIDNPKALLVLRSRNEMDTRRCKSMWESYFSRRIAPNKRAHLVPVHDFRNATGAGLIFFNMRSEN
jgi:hypothetical protein